MSSTNKTPNYNLSQFLDSDKPSWRGDYNSDMSKIDTGIKGACTQAQAAATLATDAKTSVTQLGTKVTSVETTANNAMSLAQTNEADIATNDSEFQQYKNTVNTQLSQLNQSLLSLTELVDTKLTAPPDGYQAGAHMEMHFNQASWTNTFTPNGEPIWIPFADPTGNAVGKWANKSTAGVIELKRGTYLFTARTRITNISAGQRSFRALFQLATTGDWFDTNVLACDSYSYDLGSSAPPAEALIAAVYELGETTSIRFGVKARGSGASFTAVIGESHVQVVRLNEGTGAERIMAS